MAKFSLLILIYSSLILTSCNDNVHSNNATTIKTGNNMRRNFPEWAKSSVIYEVNIRQYTKEGTINAFGKHLPRLKELGVDIIWLMPIFPISETNKKGSLGSYYAVTDYHSVNPEFGNMTDIENLIKQIHGLGMKVILDWVPNHTGWDHVWIKNHPEYYVHKDGKITDPLDENGDPFGWEDVADLNYDNMDMRSEMINNLVFWIKEKDVDGFRMDIAFGVPIDFWDTLATKLFPIKDVFMLSESEDTSHRNTGVFHANYGWRMHHLFNDIAKEKIHATSIKKLQLLNDSIYNKGVCMNFITNHDENSWNGSEFERLGDGVKAFAVLAMVYEGIPLLYSGQEEPLKSRLKFFDKDVIGFNTYDLQSFYQSLVQLKHKNEALWNENFGGRVVFDEENKNDNIIAFTREKGSNKVFVAINLSKSKQKFSISNLITGIDYFKDKRISIKSGEQINLEPWEYLIVITE